MNLENDPKDHQKGGFPPKARRFPSLVHAGSVTVTKNKIEIHVLPYPEKLNGSH